MSRRVLVVSVSLVALALAGAGPAPPASAEPPVPSIAAPERTDALSMAVMGQLDAIGQRARSEDKVWIGQLSTLYEARGGRPIWLTPTGFVTATRAVVEEIRQARNWGLEPAAFSLPDLDTATETADRAAAEVQLSLAVLKYAGHARGHRIDPSQLSNWLDQKPRPVHAGIVGLIADAEDPAAALRALHPQHPQFERLRQAWLGLQTPATDQPKPAPQVLLPSSGRILRPGVRHEDVALLRRRLDVSAAPKGATVYDEGLVEAVRAFQRSADLPVNGIVNATVRRALNGGASGGQGERSRDDDAKLLLINMERWRWMPEQLGDTHVWNNLPEFETRVFKDGEVVFQERIIIGKAATQTPVFSDRMQFVVFNPEWGIPTSIKVKDLLPKLQRGDTNVLARRGLKIVVNGRQRNASGINWDKTDIRSVPIVQGAGRSNPLGQVKFMFPNRHDVYMHDTPSKNLFNDSRRMFSAGCIRVRQPRKLAETVFGLDRGWDKTQISQMFDGTDNNRVDLTRAIDVHNVYFTAVVADDGTIRRFRDVYGHDRRIERALSGESTASIARDDPARKHEEAVKQAIADARNSGGYREARARYRESVSAFDWAPPSRQRYRQAPPPRVVTRGGVRYYYYANN